MRQACTAQNGHQYFHFISMLCSCIISEQCDQATASTQDDDEY